MLIAGIGKKDLRIGSCLCLTFSDRDAYSGKDPPMDVYLEQKSMFLFQWLLGAFLKVNRLKSYGIFLF